jgi:Domain of unknown function (DUF4145)
VIEDQKIRVEGWTPVNANPPITLRCPFCHGMATLSSLGQGDLQLSASGDLVFVGSRRCPNPDCLAHLFVVHNPDGTIIRSYPPELLDFDASNLPAGVTKALQEAITCHAVECYAAAAIMVRKTLEEVCADQEAEGKDLKKRIRALGGKIVIPTELIEGMDELRVLGNDATHVEARVYDSIDREEVETAIEFAKEILKATYQYSGLLDRLRALKDRPEADPPA